MVPMAQPAGGDMVPMAQPAGGMDILAAVPGVYIKQKVEMMEVVTNIETENKYKIKEYFPATRTAGRKLFKAKEDSDCCTRQLCGPNRPFNLNFQYEDGFGKDKFIQSWRPLKCTFLCFQRPEMFVYDANGLSLGEVVNTWALMDKTFLIKNPTPGALMESGAPCQPAPGVAQDGAVVYTIKGSCCQAGFICPCDRIVFTIYDGISENPVGEISKEFAGCTKELVTDADNFALAFPPNATPAMKAVLMTTVILIDFLFFEEKGNGDAE